MARPKMSDELATVILPFLGVTGYVWSLIVTANSIDHTLNVVVDSINFESSVTVTEWAKKQLELGVLSPDIHYTSSTMILVAGEPAKILTSQFVK